MNTSEPVVPELANHAAAATGGRSIGAILIDAGRLTPEGAERVLRLQKEQGKRFGDAAMELGLVTQDDIRFALSRQFDYPYVAPGDGRFADSLVAAYRPFSPVVEQLRALRSQLMLRWFDMETGRKCIAVVSPDHGEGRSFIAANLAVVFSQLGEKTLLIDADMRRPSQHELFRLGNTNGLSNVLAGRVAASEVVTRIPALLGLSLLPAGPIPPNPQELLGRPLFRQLLQDMSDSFDVIIIDTPAAAGFADAHTISARSGAAVLVARNHITSTPLLQQLNHGLRQADVTVVGAILNDH